MAPKAKQCVGITALLFGTAALNMHAAAATRVNVVIKRKVIKNSGKNKGRGKGRGKKSRSKQEQGQGQGQGTTPLQGSPSSPNTSSVCGSDTEESHSNTSISTAGSYPACSAMTSLNTATRWRQSATAVQDVCRRTTTCSRVGRLTW